MRRRRHEAAPRNHEHRTRRDTQASGRSQGSDPVSSGQGDEQQGSRLRSRSRCIASQTIVADRARLLWRASVISRSSASSHPLLNDSVQPAACPTRHVYRESERFARLRHFQLLTSLRLSSGVSCFRRVQCREHARSSTLQRPHVAIEGLAYSTKMTENRFFRLPGS